MKYLCFIAIIISQLVTGGCSGKILKSSSEHSDYDAETIAQVALIERPTSAGEQVQHKTTDSDTVLSDTGQSDTVPSNTVPSNAEPSDTTSSGSDAVQTSTENNTTYIGSISEASASETNNFKNEEAEMDEPLDDPSKVSRQAIVEAASSPTESVETDLADKEKPVTEDAIVNVIANQMTKTDKTQTSKEDLNYGESTGSIVELEEPEKSASLLTTEPSYPTLKPFKVKYKTEYDLGLFSIDIDAVRELKQINENEWEIIFTADAGLMKAREYSHFKLEKGQITPINYQMRSSGAIEEDDITLSFDSKNKIIYDLEKNIEHKDSWKANIQDNVTYMIQLTLDLQTDKDVFEYPIFKKKKTKISTYHRGEIETIEVPAGVFRAIRVEENNKKKKRKLQAWFAVEEDYAFIKLKDYKKGKLRYKINASWVR